MNNRFSPLWVILNQYQIPCFQQVLEFVKDLYFRLPFLKLVGWGISVDNNGNPVMIEWNRSAELSQVAHGPAFGDLTEEILDVAMRRENTRFNGIVWNYKLVNY